MQVEFGGHPYLFVNPKYRGQYIPPAEAAKTDRWVNYGGDKLWPMPEGSGDAEHWSGPYSDPLDDGQYTATTAASDAGCSVHLEGPADPITGLRYSRDIGIGNHSPEISFHAVMQNASDHAIRWSVQSVSQYDTADPHRPGDYNHNFWAYAPVNPNSAYPDGYRVRSGLADDPSFQVVDGRFNLHWLYLENEVWLDSDAGWLGVMDQAAKYGMVERFRFDASKPYPGQASLIFYKNGAALELDKQEMPVLRSANPHDAPYYMEAEINSPMIRLEPGGSYAMDTHWFPVRTSGEFREVTEAGIICRSLVATLGSGEIQLSGRFGVFFPGTLTAHVFDDHGGEAAVVELERADPLRLVELNQKIKASKGATRISLHLSDDQGVDRGSLGEARIVNPGGES